MKRTPLPPRTTPLRRTPLRSGRTKTKRRPDPLPVAIAKDIVRRDMLARDGHRCQLDNVPGAGRCAGRLTPHHRRKSGQGGGYTLENLVTLCAGHNDRLEADADLALLARTMGLVLKRGDVWDDERERFWSKVDRDGPLPAARPELGPCWLWTGQRQTSGLNYGRFYLRGDGRDVYAHRFALGCIEALVAGLEVDHLCRTPLCCNPRHLEQVTPAVNKRRQGEAHAPLSACRKAGHPYTEENLVRRADGKLECRACKAARQAAYWQRRRARELAALAEAN